MKSYWGFDSFRPVQKEIIESVLAGKDTLALLPTGGGKSVCFQVPALMMEGVCLVISPLVALMKDQVENLQKKGIPARHIHSGMTYPELRKVLENACNRQIKFLYLSPERIETDLFLEFLPALKPCLVAIDEAHCISQWGYDFRPSYLKISALREHLPETPIIALTASATPRVQQDICERLSFKSNQIFRQSFERANLSYEVLAPASKQATMLERIRQTNGSGVVYCRSRRRTAELARLLTLNGIGADFYHAGLGHDERNRKQEEWIDGQIRIMVCTNAFGMGIDKPDVRLVLHYDMPECLENYYQEAGRAGRDGQYARAVLLYGEEEFHRLEEEALIRYPHPQHLKKLYIAVMNHLQVPAGSGAGSSFDFDISLFCGYFKMNIREASFGLQLLSREGLFEINESAFMPSRIGFITDKEQLREYQTLYPSKAELIKCLLRTYEGIFDQSVYIREQQLSYLLHTEPEHIDRELKILHRDGIIRYEPKKENSRIFLLCNRMYEDDFKINGGRIENLKKEFLSRLAAMRHYADERKHCRSGIISSYFGEKQNKDCGICDNCVSKNSGETEEGHPGKMIDRILESLAGDPLTGPQLIEKIRPQNVDKFNHMLDYLIREERIEADETGKISVRKAKKKGPR